MRIPNFRKVTGAEAPALFSKPQSHFCPNALQSARKPLPAHALTRDDGGNLYPIGGDGLIRPSYNRFGYGKYCQDALGMPRG